MNAPTGPLEPSPAFRQRPGDQPLPSTGGADVFEDLISHLRARQALGVDRYGKSLQTHNGRDAIRDWTEELLDGWAYAHQARMEREELERRIMTLEKELAEARADNVAEHGEQK